MSDALNVGTVGWPRVSNSHGEAGVVTTNCVSYEFGAKIEIQNGGLEATVAEHPGVLGDVGQFEVSVGELVDFIQSSKGCRVADSVFSAGNSDVGVEVFKM